MELRRHVPLVIVVLGVMLVGTAFAEYPHAGQTYRQYHVDQRTSSDWEGKVLAYEDLSPEGKRVFDAMLDASDDRTKVYGEANFASEFPFDGGFEVVRYDDVLYRVFTYAPDGFQLLFSTVMFASIALPGLALVGVGGFLWWRDHSATPEHE